MELNRKNIPLLVKEVLNPYLKICKENLKDKSVSLRKYALLSKVITSFFNTSCCNDKRRKVLYNLLKFYRDSNVDLTTQISNIDFLLNNLASFVKKHQLDAEDNISQAINQFKILFFDIIVELSGEDENNNESITIEDAPSDTKKSTDIIDTMHYTDDEKISAVEYFNINPLSSYILEDVTLLKELFIEFLDTHTSYSDDFLENYVELAQNTITKLEFILSSKEFKNINYSFSQLLEKLENLREEGMENSKHELFYEYTLAIVEDIVKWLDTLFITQETNDVHYLDAAFYSNVEQFDILFSTEEIEDINEEDDDFLF